MPASTWTLSDWLAWLEELHPQSVDLGLDRMRKVYQRLPQIEQRSASIITVAGTNGKGSCVRACEALALAAGLRVGAYTSPHLWAYPERIRLNGEPVAEHRIVEAFETIEAVRADISLSYFEFGTLAALLIFADAELDLWVLEVGLGGRLDAVNVIDPDVAVVTSVGLDHTEWLGTDLESIAAEKLAIGRAGRPLLLGPGIPERAVENARIRGCQVRGLDREFRFSVHGGQMHSDERRIDALPAPDGLVASNLALSVLALEQLSALPARDRCIQVLSELALPGRCARVQHGDLEVILDVGHNREACAHLAGFVAGLESRRPCLAIFAALSDKPVEAMSACLDPVVDEWCLVSLNHPRALSAEALKARLSTKKTVRIMPDMADAMDYAAQHAQRALVCGSFFTVAAAGEFARE